MWSAAVTVYVMLSGRPPFKAKDREGMFQCIVQDDLQFSGEGWDRVSQ